MKKPTKEEIIESVTNLNTCLELAINAYESFNKKWDQLGTEELVRIRNENPGLESLVDRGIKLEKRMVELL